MSSVSKGARRVGSALSQFSRLGYRCSRVSASGQRKGKRREEKCIAGDLIAFAPDGSGLPNVVAEIGGVGKRLAVTFAGLRAEPLPTSRIRPDRRHRRRSATLALVLRCCQPAYIARTSRRGVANRKGWIECR